MSAGEGLADERPLPILVEVKVGGKVEKVSLSEDPDAVFLRYVVKFHGPNHMVDLDPPLRYHSFRTLASARHYFYRFIAENGGAVA